MRTRSAAQRDKVRGTGRVRAAFSRRAPPAGLRRIVQAPARLLATPVVQRTPFPGESAELEAKRTSAIAEMRAAIARVEKGLRAGHLWPFETKTADDRIENAFADPVVHSEAERSARLTKFVDDLWATVTQLEGAAAPADWFEPKVAFPEGTNDGDNMVQALYGHRMKSLGMDGLTVFCNWLYLTKDPVPARAVKGVREDYGLGLSEWLVVKDPESRPQEWVRLTGYDPIDGRIVQLRTDRRGYYYYWNGSKIYLPKYPEH